MEREEGPGGSGAHMRKRGLAFLTVLLYVVVAVPEPKAAEPEKFRAWLGEVGSQAIRQGISQRTVDKALARANYLPEVMELYRNQPEFKLSLDEYLNRVASENRISLGKQELNEHRALLEDVYRRYQVEPRFIVALWGIESDFGQISGGFPVIDSLATLAYASSRKDFYRQELLDALRILDKGRIPLDGMKGSWAGAMGQLQFMPSTFQGFAVDYDGDGKIDLWNDMGDAFVSAANYLARSGWIKDQTWGMEVSLPSELKRNMPGPNEKKLLSEWKAAGVKGVRNQDLPDNPDYPVSLIEPDPKVGRAFLTFANYNVILKWNRSAFFAIAVGLLADGIGGQKMEDR
jgi:membrane-bound lytic murein transglycosylase B